MTERKWPYTWRKRTMRGGFAPLPVVELRYGGVDPVLATAQQNRNGTWFWYGSGMNTADKPTTLESVKAEAVAYIKQVHNYGHASDKRTETE